MMIDRMQIAVIIVTISALVFVVYSIARLLKISRRTDEGVAGLESLLTELRSDIQGFRFASTHLNALIERSSAALSGLEKKLKEPLPSVPAGTNGAPVSPAFLQFTQDGIQVLQSVSDLPAEGLPNWQSENRAELNRLLAQKSRMETELHELRTRFHANESLIVDLRRKNHSVEEAESAAAQLRTHNQRLVCDVRDARRRLLETEQKYEPMIQELRLANARLEALAHPGPGAQGSEELVAGNAVLSQRVVELEAMVKQWQSKYQESEEELSRTLREKSLIEERFLQAANVE